jgi:hypothetical protein
MKTVVTNTGTGRFVGYIPPHGKTLAHGEVVTVNGDLRTVLAAGNHSPKLKIASLDADELAGNISVVTHDPVGSSD